MSFEENHQWCLEHDKLYRQVYFEMKIDFIGGMSKIKEDYIYKNIRGNCQKCGFHFMSLYKSFTTNEGFFCSSCFNKELKKGLEIKE